MERSDERAQPLVRFEEADACLPFVGDVLGTDDEAADDGVVEEVLARALEVPPLAALPEDAHFERLVGRELAGASRRIISWATGPSLAVQQAQHPGAGSKSGSSPSSRVAAAFE